MPDEVMKDFIKQVIECMERISDALQLVLQYYHVNIEEQKMKNCQKYGRRLLSILLYDKRYTRRIQYGEKTELLYHAD